MAILRINTTLLPVLPGIQFVMQCGKCLQHIITAGLPVFTVKNHNKIIATDMAEKIDIMIDMLTQNSSGFGNNIVAFVITISVVIRFEIIQIEVTDGDISLLANGLLNMFIKRHITRQTAERIGMAGNG